MKIIQLDDLKEEFTNNNNFKDLMKQLFSEASSGGDVEVYDLSTLSILESNLFAVPFDKSDSRRSIKKPLVANITRVKEITIWNTASVIICKKENIEDKAFIFYRDWESGQLRLYIG